MMDKQSASPEQSASSLFVPRTLRLPPYRITQSEQAKTNTPPDSYDALLQKKYAREQATLLRYRGTQFLSEATYRSVNDFLEASGVQAEGATFLVRSNAQAFVATRSILKTSDRLFHRLHAQDAGCSPVAITKRDSPDSTALQMASSAAAMSGLRIYEPTGKRRLSLVRRGIATKKDKRFLGLALEKGFYTYIGASYRELLFECPEATTMKFKIKGINEPVDLAIPGKYLFYGYEGKVSLVSPFVLGAITLELLSHKIPGFYSTLIAARNSLDPSPLHKLLDIPHPGAKHNLAETLLHCLGTPNGQYRALGYVVTRLYGRGKWDVTGYASQLANTRAFFAGRVKKYKSLHKAL